MTKGMQMGGPPPPPPMPGMNALPALPSVNRVGGEIPPPGTLPGFSKPNTGKGTYIHTYIHSIGLGSKKERQRFTLVSSRWFSFSTDEKH